MAIPEDGSQHQSPAAAPLPRRRTHHLVALVLVAFTLYTWLRGFGTVQSLLSEAPPRISGSLVRSLLSWVWLPIATVQFWRHQKSGWILTAGFLSFSLPNPFSLFAIVFQFEGAHDPIANQLRAVFVVVALVYLLRKSIRKFFGVSTREAWLTVIPCVLASEVPLVQALVEFFVNRFAG